MDLPKALLHAASQHQGVLTTLKRDGRPQLSNIAYDVTDGVVRISITADRAKYANATRDPRVSLYVGRKDFGAYVVLEGDADVTPPAEATDDDTVDALIDLYRAMAGEHPDWDDYRRAMVADQRAVQLRAVARVWDVAGLMGHREPAHPARLRRLEEELAEAGFEPGGSVAWREMLLIELDYALRPTVHERRVPSVGTIIEPTSDTTAWEDGTLLNISRGSLRDYPIEGARRFADGMSSFLVRRLEDDDEFVVFDRPAGSERDLVVLAEALDATIVQRHPSGLVRVVGSFGVLRWDGLSWHNEPPLRSWVDTVSACGTYGNKRVLAKLLAFAVHDLGARGIGALLVYEPDPPAGASYQRRFPTPPPLRIDRASDLAPLRHVLGQIDGGAVFDRDGVLRELGVRLVPSAEAESDVDGYRGMRHTSGRRYSFDEPEATVIVVSDDGPVTVLRKGEVLGSSSERWVPPELAAMAVDD